MPTGKAAFPLDKWLDFQRETVSLIAGNQAQPFGKQTQPFQNQSLLSFGINAIKIGNQAQPFRNQAQPFAALTLLYVILGDIGALWINCSIMTKPLILLAESLILFVKSRNLLVKPRNHIAIYVSKSSAL